MSQIKVRLLKHHPAELAVPGDRWISHLAVMLAGMCDGTTVVENFLPTDECLASLEAMKALGAACEVIETDDFGRPVKLAMTGRGMQLMSPEAPLDCGSSATTMCLLMGILAAQPFTSSLAADETLSKQPMRLVADALSEMGAKIDGQGGNVSAPLTIRGTQLSPIVCSLPGLSEHAKGAVLLAGWNTPGKTSVIEPVPIRDHTERILDHFRVKCVRERCRPDIPGHGGAVVSIYGNQPPTPNDLHVPGDISSAALWMVAAGAWKNARLTLLDLGLNPGRTGVISVLIRMGVKIVEHMEVDEGEPRGHVVVHGGELNGTHIGGAEVSGVVDELPILAVAGALAHGSTTIRDAGELRAEGLDRLSAIAHNLRQMGVQVEEFHDGMEIVGGTPLRGAELSGYGDPHLSMAFAIAGLFADGVTTVSDAECVAATYPCFERHLALFLDTPRIVSESTPVIDRMPPKVGARLAQLQQP